MTGFVYKWTNRLNGKWYIGSHIGELDDGYVASGALIKKSIAKHGLEVFEREILYIGDDCRLVEGRMLKELNAAKDQKSYNLKNETLGGNGSANKGRVFSEEHIRKLRESHIGNYSNKKGKTHSEIYGEDSVRIRQQLSTALRGKQLEKVLCPKCGLVGGKPIMSRFHFDKCKKAVI